MVWLVILLLLVICIMETLDHVSASISSPTTLYQEGEKPFNFAHCFCRLRESNPCCLCSKQVRYSLLHCLSVHSVSIKTEVVVLSSNETNHAGKQDLYECHEIHSLRQVSVKPHKYKTTVSVIYPATYLKLSRCLTVLIQEYLVRVCKSFCKHRR